MSLNDQYKEIVARNLQRIVNHAEQLVKDKTPIDTWDLKKSLTQKKISDFEIDLTFDKKEYASFVEYWVKWKEYNYHLENEIYTWEGAWMIRQVYDELNWKLWKEITVWMIN